MKLIPRLNDYKHQVIDCPFCKGWVYVREISKGSPDPLRDLKRHITNQAKNEAFDTALIGNIGEPVPQEHLTYYRDHTSMQPLRTGVLKRQYDHDMSL